MAEPIYLLHNSPGKVQDVLSDECPPAVEASLRQKREELTHHHHAEHDHQHSGPTPSTALKSPLPELPGEVVRTTWHLERMDCPVEEQLIRNRLKGESGIAELNFDLLQRRLTIAHEPGRDFEPILASLGMEPSLLGESGVIAPNTAKPRREWLALGIAGVLAFAAEGWAFAVHDDQAIPVILLSAGALLLGGRAPLTKAWLALKNFTLNIYLLMALAVGGAVAIRHWPEAATVTVLFALSEMIEAQALGRARRAIQELEALAPDTAEVLGDCGDWHEVSAGAVRRGQMARVRPGGRVPLDGLVREGRSAVNQAPVTGESLPVEKAPGDEVFAGSVNGHSAFTFEVTATQNDSTIARIARAVQEAHSQRAPVQRFVDSFARVYTPLVVLCALGVALLPPLFFNISWSECLYRALVLLVIACPCALVISTPVTVVSGLTLAARRGLIIKGGLFLEQGRRLRALAFDKTGTLTLGRPQITKIVALLSLSDTECLHRAASLNAQSEHPLAVAFWEKWQEQNEKVLSVENFTALPGRGVQGDIQKQSYWLGNARLAAENSAAVPTQTTALENAGQTVVLLGHGSEVLALFAIADAPRAEAANVVQQLKAQGLTPILLSGDNPEVVRAIAQKLGIERAHGGLLPEEKLAAIAGLEEEFGAVGMVGDGINDAPALARATIGFAMGAAGTAAAIETADVALLQDDLGKLPLFVTISRATMRVLWQNITLALGIKAVFFGLAVAGHASLWMAVFADVGASLLVILNGLRLLKSNVS